MVWIATRILGDSIVHHGERPTLCVDYLVKSLEDSEASVRLAAIHGLSLHRETSATRPLIQRLRSDESSLCRRAASEALGRFKSREAVGAIFEALATEPDSHAMDHTLGLALIEIADIDALRVSFEAEHPKVKRAALMALQQIDGSNLRTNHVLPLLESESPLVRAAAWWVVARRAREWGGDIAEFLRSQLMNPKLDAAVRSDLLRNLQSVVSAPQLQSLIAELILDSKSPNETRLLLLEAIASSTGSSGVLVWWEAAATIVASPLDWTDEVLNAAAATLGAMPKLHVNNPSDAQKHKVEQLQQKLRRVASDARLDAEARLSVLLAVPKSTEALDDTTYDFLCESIRNERPLAVRTRAAELLAESLLTDEQQYTLVEVLNATGTQELNRVIDCFKNCSSEKVGRKLVAEWSRSATIDSLDPIRIQNLLKQFGSEVYNDAAPLLARFESVDREQMLRFERVIDSVSQANREHGLSVFQSKKYSCQTCHVAVLVGGNIGPTLVGLGKRRSERDILESIMFPNASFVQSYETWQVQTNYGTTVSGVLLSDTPESIQLGTSKGVETISRSEIETMKRSNISVMPTGLDRLMSDQELADLVAYLKSL
jgi:putative heme-binding domain-containing protein